MTRREQNHSRHNHRKDCIYWTLEWRFNSTDVVLTDHDGYRHRTIWFLLTVMQIMADPRSLEEAMGLIVGRVVVLGAVGYMVLVLFPMGSAMVISI